MENSQKSVADSPAVSGAGKNSKKKAVHSDLKKPFLQQYDEVLNKQILYLFRKTNEEHDRAHDHRALKVIDGELVNLRLDSLNGQADGIKVSLEKESVPMYIWFSPGALAGQIIFKTVCGERRKRMCYQLEQITPDFLINLIRTVFIPANRLALG